MPAAAFFGFDTAEPQHDDPRLPRRLCALLIFALAALLWMPFILIAVGWL